MKIARFRDVSRVFILFFVVLLSGTAAMAKDVPVTSRALQGRWLLLDVTTQDQQARMTLLESRLDMTFRSDKTVTLESRNPEAMSGTDSRKGVYRVEDGKIVITLEGEAGDAARAVIRDGKHLVFLPSDKFHGEMIFARVKE